MKMLTVQICTASGTKQILTTDKSLKIDELCGHIKGLTENFYILHNGKLVNNNTTCYNGYISIVPRLYGGKGGFGSMLRAIGAQIEKTTNREACRDLSGRRLRDINEEKRLKTWIEKQETRKEEAVERKKKRLERLCAEPKVNFQDHAYEQERSVLTERVGDAVEEGFKVTGTKRKHEENLKPNKRKMILDLEVDSDELDSASESDEDEKVVRNIKCTETTSNDNGHSSNENQHTVEKTETEDKYSDVSCDSEINDKNLNTMVT